MLHDSSANEVWDSDKNGASGKENPGAGDEVRNDHEQEPTHKRDESTLTLAVDEEAKPKGAEEQTQHQGGGV